VLDERSAHLRSLVVRALEDDDRGQVGASKSPIGIMRILLWRGGAVDPANLKAPLRDRIILSKRPARGSAQKGQSDPRVCVAL
jgi:transketolase N-terminal domain/subunit